MSKRTLFTVLTGQSDHTFTINDLEFAAAPLTITEYAVYLNLPDTEDARADFVAEKLRMRLRPKAQVDPSSITAQWYMDHFPQARVNDLMHVLVHGTMPDNEKKTS